MGKNRKTSKADQCWHRSYWARGHEFCLFGICSYNVLIYHNQEWGCLKKLSQRMVGLTYCRL